jgi:hypothetical protein
MFKHKRPLAVAGTQMGSVEGVEAVDDLGREHLMARHNMSRYFAFRLMRQ